MFFSLLYFELSQCNPLSLHLLVCVLISLYLPKIQLKLSLRMQAIKSATPSFLFNLCKTATNIREAEKG